MRGKRASGVPFCAMGGLIPAHAGKTTTRLATLWTTWAHPRACGENIGQTILGDIAEGSSPRMRGKHSDRAIPRSGDGLIPAHAGKTARQVCRQPVSRAHPRACGENSLRFDDPVRPPGSSPRMRGKLPGAPKGTRLVGLIPAHAGKTSRKQKTLAAA